MSTSAPRFSKPPAIRQLPDDPTRLHLECQVQATPQPDVTWFQNDASLSNTSNKQKQTITSTADNTYDIALEISDLAASDSGTYKVLIKNSVGEITANLSLNFSNDDNAESTADTTR
jgi:hypothetical protein